MLLALIAGLLVSVILATIVGPVWIPPQTVWKVALHEATGFLRPDWSAAEAQIVWQIRFPRVLLAAVVGAGLSVVGTALQAAVRNPLADPFLLGGSSGASVGAVLVIVGGLQVFGVYSLSVAAFAGASAASSSSWPSPAPPADTPHRCAWCWPAWPSPTLSQASRASSSFAPTTRRRFDPSSSGL